MKKLFLAALFPMVAGMLAGCYVAPDDRDTYVSPPPPRYVVVEQRPGYMWIDGHWYWGSGNWLWNDGYYVVDRPGYVWAPGYYHGHTYYPGQWRNGGGNYYTPRPSQASRTIEQARIGAHNSQAQGYTQGSRAVQGAPRTYSAPAGVAPSRATQAIPRSAPTSAPAPARSSGHVRDHRK